jgi:hypothetical protein
MKSGMQFSIFGPTFLRAITFAGLFAILCVPVPCGAEESQEDEDDGSFLKAVLFYIPNRVLDIVDIARARVRVGPGITLGVRATEAVDAYIGSYTSVYAGLPGPRMRKIPKLPAGLETSSGIELSAADATLDGGLGPDYSPTEFGVSVHAAIVGADVGLDPVEILDAVLGFLFIDIRDDDF